MSTRINSLRAYHEANKDAVNKGNSYSVPPAALEEVPGFNVRDYNDPDVVAHIRALADAYARGDFIPPIVVRVEEGRLLVREGHCRRRALLLAIEEGAQIERTNVIEHRGDEVQQSLLILTSNQGLQVKPLERAEIYRRLHVWGKSVDEIARSIGRSATHVAQWLQLIELPIALKERIRADEISPTAALELYQKKGAAAVAIVESAVKDAKESGRSRVTTKNLSSGPRLTKQVVASMGTHFLALGERLERAVADTDSDTVSVELTIEEAKQILELRAKVQGEASPA